MEKADKIKQLRELTGMNRKEFCEYFQIPYRTVSEWERDGRHAPDYLVRLLEYYIRIEQITKDKVDANRIPIWNHLCGSISGRLSEYGKEAGKRNDSCQGF